MRKYDEVVAEIQEVLADEDIFVTVCEELDSWNGFLGDDRLYPMDELDDLFCGCKVSEFAEKIGRDFDFRDDYICFSIYGIESTSDSPYSVYSSIWDEGDLFDELADNRGNIDLMWIDSELSDLFDELDEIRDADEEDGE